MNGGDLFFTDTNVLLYTLESAALEKQRSARRWIDLLWEHGAGRLSWQVLNEYYANATGKIGAPPPAIRGSVEMYVLWNPAHCTFNTVQRAWHWKDQAGVPYWDGLILAAAESQGCRWLLSEDFQDGRKYGDIQVIDPFTSDPERFFPR